MLRSFLSSLAFAAAASAIAAPAATAAPQSTSRTAAKPVSTATVNINSASLTELQTLPGVGAAMAQRIVEYRQKNGPFKKAEDLMNVRGIGEKNFLKLKPQISVATAATKTDRPAGASN